MLATFFIRNELKQSHLVRRRNVTLSSKFNSRHYCETSEKRNIKPHLNLKYLKENVELVKQNVLNRAHTVNVDKVVSLFDQFLQKGPLLSQLRHDRNLVSERLKNENMTKQDKENLVEEGRVLREKIKEETIEFEKLHSALYEEGSKIPNSTHPDVPLGKEPKLLELVGSPPKFEGFQPKDHVRLGKELDLFDFEAGAEVAGGSFYYTKNEAVLLELALQTWVTQLLMKKGFTAVLTPDVVYTRFAEACGFHPRSEHDQMYQITDHDLTLVATAEIPTAAMFYNKLYNKKDYEHFPKKIVAFGHCFRVETGHRGRMSRGLYRVHQFSKVEMFIVCFEEDSERLHNELLNIQIDIFKQLNLHFRVLDMPASDLGSSAYRKYDIEAWFPSLNGYGEITSASNCTDYQTRRLNVRAKDSAESTSRFLHTLNATALAIPRTIMAILENFQTEDGSVKIPEVLLPFMNGITHFRPK